MSLEYDAKNGQLNVTISHSVGDRSTHYIEEIEIRKNGNVIKSEDYTSQPDNSEFTYTYQVDAEKDDSLNIEANCNQGGSIEKTVEITDEGTKTTGGDDTPFLSLGVFILVVSLVAITRTYRKR